MFEIVEECSEKFPQAIAYEFFGKKVSYARMVEDITECAKALKAHGVEKGDKVTLALPNCPQAVTVFYAVNMIGAVANMVHPLSGEMEFKEYIDLSGSKIAFILDTFYSKMRNLRGTTSLEEIVVTTVQDGLGAIKGALYSLKNECAVKKPYDEGTCMWKTFLSDGKSHTGTVKADVGPMDPAVILYSGGTTGSTKGVIHCSDAFNALAEQLGHVADIRKDNIMISVLPMFHGFGVGVSIHTVFYYGMTSILEPRFSPEPFIKKIVKYRDNFFAGPPSLFEALVKNEKFAKSDLSGIKGSFIGSDSISPERERIICKAFVERGAPRPRQGYGLAECIAAVCLLPEGSDRYGTIGTALVGEDIIITEVGGTNELPRGELGEICINGPTNMLGYLNNPDETERTLKEHPDGRKWVHTGDLGTMDENGFITYVQRLKRMIITNGYNVYPSQMEEILDRHPKIRNSCVVGVPHPEKGQAIKVFAILEGGVERSESTKTEIMDYIRQNVAKYAKPYDIEFRDSFPQTKVAKIAYRDLEKEETDRLKSLGKL
ncbi:MAG: AMP-binding protein [archaeon]|nr:AMP-binding protein [archaeon]